MNYYSFIFVLKIGICLWHTQIHWNAIYKQKIIDLILNINTQKLAHIDQRERNRHELERKELESGTAMSNQTKAEEIILLEKQGICSQKIRNNMTGNLAQVTHTIGQNMTDISNIGGNNSKKVERFIQFYMNIIYIIYFLFP